VTTREVLVEAQSLIDVPSKWGQKWFTDRKGRKCAVGALIEACPGDLDCFIDARDLLEALAGQSVVSFNDSHTHAEVMDLYRQAIQVAA
jgi:hypothetical protein